MKSAVNKINKINFCVQQRCRTPFSVPTLLVVCALLLALVPSALLQPSPRAMVNQEFTASLEKFGSNLFSVLASTRANQNIVFSPFSIQTCVTMARLGATGQTAEQMDSVMGTKSTDVEALAENYYNLLSQYEKSDLLKIANKIYIMKNYEVQDKYNELLQKKFFSAAENIDFAQSQMAANNINSWVEAKTNNLIKNLVDPGSLSSDTRLVLLNAIHFKGEWQHEFPAHSTVSKKFYTDETNSVNVQMMHQTSRFRYGDFPELEATALEMPYKGSDLSMLIILPNSRTGLSALEEKLKSTSLQELSQKMYQQSVIVQMPKFKAEFSVELNEPLQKLGMTRMFSDNAEFEKMLKSPEALKISKAIHKAFIEVNEKGTEAAAATGFYVNQIAPSLVPTVTYFIIDHPFFYRIIDRNGVVLFAGRMSGL